MRQYLQLCEKILFTGKKREDRTGTGTVGIFGHQMRFDLAEGFPLLTTKDMMAPFRNGNTALDSIIHELLMFLSGSTDVKYLLDRGVGIWNGDAYRNYLEKTREHTPLTMKEFLDQMMNSELFAKQWGDLGRIYGAQWRSWNAGIDMSGEYPRKKTVDQIKNVVEGIKNDPFGRRHVVSAWNPGELDQMALPPCHVLFQFHVSDGKLSCQLYQRSGDVFLGVPFNIASYALLTMMVADQCGLGYGEFIHTLGDAHIYLNHLNQVHTQIQREPKPLPKMTILTVPKDIFSYKREDFFLSGYDAHGALHGKVSVGL